MTREKAIRIASKWAEGHVCTLREGEAQEYHKLCLEALLKQPRWIPVTERLPDDSVGVTLCTRSGIVGTGFYDKYTKNWVQYYAAGALCVDVTHWMPLPEGPEVEV